VNDFCGQFVGLENISKIDFLARTPEEMYLKLRSGK